MMKLIKVLMVIIAFSGCSGPKEEAPFKSIDYSFFAGYINSIKIYSSKKTLITTRLDNMGCKQCYSLKIDKTNLDSISNMIRVLSNLKLDSIYYAELCDHCISFILIIKSNGNILSTSYHGQYDEKELNPLFHLTDYLDKIIMNVTESSDSVFVFESKPKLILPPPSPAPPIQN